MKEKNHWKNKNEAIIQVLYEVWNHKRLPRAAFYKIRDLRRKSGK